MQLNQYTGTSFPIKRFSISNTLRIFSASRFFSFIMTAWNSEESSESYRFSDLLQSSANERVINVPGPSMFEQVFQKQNISRNPLNWHYQPKEVRTVYISHKQWFQVIQIKGMWLQKVDVTRIIVISSQFLGCCIEIIYIHSINTEDWSLWNYYWQHKPTISRKTGPIWVAEDHWANFWSNSFSNFTLAL